MDIKHDVCGLDSLSLGWGPLVGSCEHGNESSSSVNCWKYEQLSNYWLLRKVTEQMKG
jgi:hypothetical protein